MVNEQFFFESFRFATTTLIALVSVGLVVAGIVYIRRVSRAAALCLVGAGALNLIAIVVRTLINAMVEGTGTTNISTATRILTMFSSILAVMLLPLAIFLLANAIKQRSRSSP